MKAYTIGLDFGTLSGRAILADTQTGQILADSVWEYPHAVLNEQLPDGTKLPDGWALQVPADYMEVLDKTIPEVIAKSGVDSEQIVGIGIDFTSATVIPVLGDGTPLCELPEFQSERNAYAKLWKHHSAWKEAERIRTVLEEDDPDWFKDNLQVISSESQIAKILETVDQAPEVYDKAVHYMEAGDWIVFQLCKKFSKSVCSVGLKGLYHSQKGWPKADLLKKINPKFENYLSEKWNYPVYEMGACVGMVTEEAARRFGLSEKCAVAVALIDGHAAPPACGVTDPETLLMIVGTGSTHTMIAEDYRSVEGVCGIVKGGVYPDRYLYEAGQCCVGDHYAWFSSKYFPETYKKEADLQGLSAHEFLTQKAAELEPGESGLLALDWWNGNRSTLMNSSLRGMIMGMDLQTRPEEIYRALIEGTAFGARMIQNQYKNAGFRIREIYATGGISAKNPLVMQIYADILNVPIRLAGIRYGSALGSAMYAAVAAGKKQGGYDSLFEAVEVMKDVSDIVYYPIKEHTVVYDRLFQTYETLYQYFGKEHPELMKSLIAE